MKKANITIASITAYPFVIIMFGGPLSHLYYMGFFPCCQKEEDKNAREALSQLNTVGARIIWHRDNRNRLVENVKAAAFSFLSKNKNATKQDDKNPLVKACIRIYDNPEGIPEIQVAKRSVVAASAAAKYSDDADMDAGEFGGLGAFQDEEQPESKKKGKPKKDKNEEITIVLKQIHTVTPVEQDLITLNILTPDGQHTKEWVKFALEAQDQAARNMFVHNLQVLMEWDKNRRNECGELEYDETAAASTLRSRAQKAAHFARRELEMKQTKRSREERKAKYVEESGGLKYTAIAMARNAGGS